MKFFAVLNKKKPLTSQLNALAHTSLGLSLKYPIDTIGFSEFSSKGSSSISYLTDAPFIILTAKNANQLRIFHKELIERNFPQSAFYQTMIDGGTVEAQLETVADSSLDDLDYVAVLTYGDDEMMSQLTKKFSLYKNPALVTS